MPSLAFPKFLIQARAKDTPDAPWGVIEFAWIETQRDLNLARWRANPNHSDLEFQVVPNETNLTVDPVPPAPVIVERAAALPVGAIILSKQAQGAIQAELVKELGMEKALRILSPLFVDPINSGGTAAPFPEPAPVDALAGVTPLPFGEGDGARDIHTGYVVTVSKIYPADMSGRGFDWVCPQHPTDKSGHVRYNAIGNFEKSDLTPAERAEHNIKLATAKPVSFPAMPPIAPAPVAPHLTVKK